MSMGSANSSNSGATGDRIGCCAHRFRVLLWTCKFRCGVLFGVGIVFVLFLVLSIILWRVCLVLVWYEKSRLTLGDC